MVCDQGSSNVTAIAVPGASAGRAEARTSWPLKLAAATTDRAVSSPEFRMFIATASLPGWAVALTSVRMLIVPAAPDVADASKHETDSASAQGGRRHTHQPPRDSLRSFG